MAIFILIDETSFEARAGDMDTREEKETELWVRGGGRVNEGRIVLYVLTIMSLFNILTTRLAERSKPDVAPWLESHCGNLARGQPVWICLYVLQEV